MNSKRALMTKNATPKASKQKKPSPAKTPAETLAAQAKRAGLTKMPKQAGPGRPSDPNKDKRVSTAIEASAWVALQALAKRRRVSVFKILQTWIEQSLEAVTSYKGRVKTDGYNYDITSSRVPPELPRDSESALLASIHRGPAINKLVETDRSRRGKPLDL